MVAVIVILSPQHQPPPLPLGLEEERDGLARKTDSVSSQGLLSRDTFTFLSITNKQKNLCEIKILNPQFSFIVGLKI